MTTVFYDTPIYPGLCADRARVTSIEGRVLVRAIDVLAEEAVTVAFSPDQARAVAQAIIAAADDAAAQHMRTA